MLPSQTDSKIYRLEQSLFRDGVARGISLAYHFTSDASDLATGKIENGSVPDAGGLQARLSAFGYGRTGNVNLDAAAFSATTNRAAIVNADVATFRSSSCTAVVDFAVEDETGSNSGADGKIEHFRKSFSGAPENFGKSCSVGIIFNFYRQMIAA